MTLGRIADHMLVPLFDDPDKAIEYAKTKGVDLWSLIKEQMEVEALEKLVEGKA